MSQIDLLGTHLWFKQTLRFELQSMDQVDLTCSGPIYGSNISYLLSSNLQSQSTEAAEYFDYNSAEELYSRNEFSGYNTKQSDGDLQVTWNFGECGVPLYCHHFQVHSAQEW